jgi:hypothetical protein
MPPDLADVPEVDKVLAVDLEKPVELSVSRAVSSGVIVCSPSGGVAMNHLRSSFILLLLCAVAAVPGTAQESVEVPFYLPTPEGWRTETIPFPLEFAPELDYEGLEELRFAPGMFKEGSADFWSYAFVTRKPIQLNVNIDIVPCSSQGQVAAIFQLSPQPHESSIWEVLAKLRQEFRCER